MLAELLLLKDLHCFAGLVAQTNALLTGDQEASGLIPTRSGNILS